MLNKDLTYLRNGIVSYLGHSLGVSNPSAEMQSVYSKSLADWGKM